MFILNPCAPCIFNRRAFRRHNKEFGDLARTERPSRSPFCSAFQKYPPAGRQPTLCADDVVAVQDCQYRCVSAVLRFLITLEPAASSVLREVRGVTCSVLCYHNESHIGHKSWCFLSPPCCRLGNFERGKARISYELITAPHSSRYCKTRRHEVDDMQLWYSNRDEV